MHTSVSASVGIVAIIVLVPVVLEGGASQHTFPLSMNWRIAPEPFRIAKDGIVYTKEQFMDYYGPRGETEWSAATIHGAAEDANYLAVAPKNASPEQRLSSMSETPCSSSDATLPSQVEAHPAPMSPRQRSLVPTCSSGESLDSFGSAQINNGSHCSEEEPRFVMCKLLLIATSST